MATYRVLGQTAPTSTTAAELYTVPSLTSTVLSSITITNITATDTTYRVHVVKSGGSGAATNALVYDEVIRARSMTALTLGVSLATGDAIYAAPGANNAVVFHAFGSEV